MHSFQMKDVAGGADQKNTSHNQNSHIHALYIITWTRNYKMCTDRWMDGLLISVVYNSISVISGRW